MIEVNRRENKIRGCLNVKHENYDTQLNAQEKFFILV